MGYNTVSVGTTATEIVGAETRRKALMLCNTEASVLVYIGPDSSVTTANGMPLYEFQNKEFTKSISEHWAGPVYGIVADGTADVRYWEVVGG